MIGWAGVDGIHFCTTKGFDEIIFAVSFGIIGGADGPTTIIIGQPNCQEAQRHGANSSLRFEPTDKIEWRIVFQEKPNEKITVSLI